MVDAWISPPPGLEAATEAQRERDLVDRHRRGERAAFEEYYARYGALIYNLTLRHCGDPDLAQDLTQEILLRIFRSLGRFRGLSSLKTWTYRVALNHCRSRLGRRRRFSFTSLSADEPQADLPDPARGPEEMAIASEAGARLAAVLPRVELTFREAVVLRDLEGLSYQEIAAVLDVPIGTVRSRIARGREQLRRLLGGSDSPEDQPPEAVGHP